MKTHSLMFVVVMSIACGDDGSGEEPEGTSTGGSGSSTSTSSSSTTNVGTNTTSNSGSEGESSSSTTDGTSGSSGSGTTASSDTDTDTDSGGGCGAIMDEQACMDANCAWVGPGGMGNCVEPGDMCKGVMFEMQCNFIPGCQWSEDEMACLPGA